MLKYLLPKTGKFYKANLHCHTTLSDGRWTPEKVKEEYKAKGYSIVAYTEHGRMIPHHELTDESFLAMTGYEWEFFQYEPLEKDCHLCFVALTPEINDENNKPDFVRDYTHEAVNKMIKTMRESGFFVTYNHPAWSNQDYSDYIGYEGMHAMEIVNYGCVESGYDEYNPHVYDDMIKHGKRVYCIATDDNHNARNDSFGGFTMIKAESLDYKTIGEALLQGNFYASEAPLIYELTYDTETRILRVVCSPAVKVSINTDRISASVVYPESGKTLTEAEFTLRTDIKYVRLTVMDEQGKHACTNAYYLDELSKIDF